MDLIFTKEVVDAHACVRAHLNEFQTKDFTPVVSIVLGTGLTGFLDGLEGKSELSYDKITNMPKCTISGHAGKLVFGTLGKVQVMVFAGRFHRYEGIPESHVCFQVRLSRMVGSRVFLLTNSTGGLQNNMYEGCFLLIKDHIRLYGRVDPMEQLRHEVSWKREKVDSHWAEEFFEKARNVAKSIDLPLYEGVYTYSSGPSYETPLEVRVAMQFDGGVVGMSTVPEVLCANAHGMQVLGLSMVTNLGAGLQKKPLTHKEVKENAKNAIPNFIELLRGIVMKIETRNEELEVQSYSNKLQFVPFSETDLKSTFIQATKGIPAPKTPLVRTLYLVDTDALESTLDEKVVLPLKQIPGMPLRSPGANLGTLSFGYSQVKEGWIYVVNAKSEEGFTDEESAFLAILFLSLGITKVIMTVRNSVKVDKPEIQTISSLINYSLITRQLEILYRLSPNSADKYADKCLFEDGDDDNVYIVFQGACEPSKAEQNMCKSFGATLIGKTSIAPLYAFQYFGASTECVYNSGVDKNEEVKFLNNLSDGVEEPISVQIEDTLTTLLPTVIEYKLAEQIGKGLQEKMQRKWNQKFILNFNYDYEISKDKVLQTIPFSDVPGLKDFYQGTYVESFFEKAEFIEVISGEESTLVLKNPFKSYAPYYVQDLRIVIRSLMTLKLRELIVSARMQKVDDKVDDIVQLRDHVNLIGENALFGPNESKWGPRFPDMTDIYSFKHDSLKDIPYVNGAFVVPTSIAATKAMARNISCSTICSVGLPEILTGIHNHDHSVSLSMIGLTNDEQLPKLTQLLNQLL